MYFRKHTYLLLDRIFDLDPMGLINVHVQFQVWFQNKRSKERRMKQMTTGMMAGRGFFPPGKGGRRGFPIIGEEFGYFGPHDKPPFPHDFGYPPNFPPPPPDGFFPGPMGFMGKKYMN